MRVARPVILSDAQRRELSQIASSKTVSVRFAQRAKIILLAGDGLQDKQIAAIVRVRRQAVALWRGRFLDLGIDGIAKDAPRGGRQRTARSPDKVHAIIERTTQTTPPDATHWSTNSMARAAGVSASTVGRVWREHGLKPWQVGTFKLSRDPAFAEKVADVVGLYLAPPGGAVVLSIDEKTQIQALDRTQPTLPLDCGKTEKKTHDYVRHGTTNLFAALNVTTGEVFGECRPTRTGQDFLDCLRKAVKSHVDKEIHVVLDNLSTHTTP